MVRATNNYSGIVVKISVALVVALFLQEYVSNFFPIANYCDEFIAVLGFGTLCLNVIANHGIVRMQRWKIRVFVLFGLVLGWGLLGNFFSEVPRTAFDVMLDAFNLVKFWGSFLFFDQVLGKNEKQLALKKVRNFSAVFTLCAVLFWLPSQLSILEMTGDMRFGIKSYSFIYNNPGSFSNYCVVLLLISLFNDKNKKINVITVLDWLLLISTLRFKALGVAMFFLVFAFGRIKSQREKLLKISVGFLGALLVGMEQIENYFISGDTPRRLFWVYAVKIANDYFPFGSGLGTFGTSAAAGNYSPLYEKYGMSKYWFFQVSNGYNYLNDNFWPAILGQYGWIGILFYIYIIVWLYRSMRDACGSNEMKILAVYTLFATIIIASLGGPILFGQYGVLFFSLASIILS